MSDTDLLFTPAAKAAALIRAKKLSPVEYLDAVLKAIDKTNPKLNCFREVMADDARRDAKKAEEAVMRGEPLGPLHGVPVSVKDLVDVKGVPTRHGSAIFEGNPPAAADDILVKRLRDAGAIIFAKATTPEFGVKGLTDGPSFGITRNPWNLERTPGGSSGGGAAAVAAGLGPSSLGTDGAGSVRGPASCSGLVGLKPTLGVVPYDTTRDAFGNNVYAGPLSRTITDAAILHEVIRGPSAKDPVDPGRRAAASAIAQARGRGSVRRAHRLYRAHRQSAHRRRRAHQHARLPRRLGSDGRRRRGSDREDRLDRIRGPRALPGELRGVLRAVPAQVAEPDGPGDARLHAARRQVHARRLPQRPVRAHRLFRKIQTLFERYDFLVTPTNARTALDVGHDAANDEVIVDGVKCGITRQGWTSYQYPFNLTGHPALAVPSGFGTDHMPTSVQIVGKWAAETDVLRLGALLERARPWAQHRPENS